MKWKGQRKSSNVEDRRGQSTGGGGINPLLLGPLIRLLFSKKGLIIIGVFLIFSLVTGNNPLNFIGQIFGGANPTQSSIPYQSNAEESELVAFSETILANTEDVWSQLLNGYRPPTLVLFNNSVQSACGFASQCYRAFLLSW
jgi:predicted metalloprotease